MTPLRDEPADLGDRASAPSLALTIARLVPWAVLIGHAIWLGSLAFLDGALALAFLMVPWVSFVALSRRWSRRLKTKMARIGLDLAVITTCVVLVSLGGLWMLPGATAFAALDVIEPGTEGTRRRAAFMLGGVILLAALPGLLFAFIIWPAALVSAVSLFVPVTTSPTAQEPMNELTDEPAEEPTDEPADDIEEEPG